MCAIQSRLSCLPDTRYTIKTQAQNLPDTYTTSDAEYQGSPDTFNNMLYRKKAPINKSLDKTRQSMSSNV